MGLIICKDCGKEYSDMSPVCINCGCPTVYNTTDSKKDARVENKQNMPPRKTTIPKKVIPLAIIVLLMIVVVIVKMIDATSNGYESAMLKNEANNAASVTGESITLNLQIGNLPGNFTGSLKGDLPEGYGTFNCGEKGWIYNGEWEMGHFSGNGERIANNGQTEEGTYENDLLNGSGAYKDPSGFEYSGTFKDGVFNGTGSMRFPYTGTGFQGEFKNGIPDESFKSVCSPISMVAIPYNILQYQNIFGQAVSCGGDTMSLISGEERVGYSGGDLLYSLKSSNGDKYYIVSIGQGLYCVIVLDTNVSLNVGQFIQFYGISIGTYDTGSEEYPLIKAFYYDYL